MLPADFTEVRRWDSYRLHIAFVMACPPSLAAALEPVRRSPALGSRELCRGLLAGVAAGSSTPHQMALLSLGHCHPEHYTALLEEVPLLLEECARSGSKKGRSRPEEVRGLCVWGGGAVWLGWGLSVGVWATGGGGVLCMCAGCVCGLGGSARDYSCCPGVMCAWSIVVGMPMHLHCTM